MADVLEEEQRQSSESDASLVGRKTFESFREYWPKQTDDTTGIREYLKPRTEVRRVHDARRYTMGELNRAVG